MTIIVGGGGASSGGSGAISGGFKIFELMFNQTTDAALPVGTYRPAVFPDKASMQAYFTKHTTEFDRLKISGRVCEIGTIDAQGKPLTINNEAYSYVEGETGPWVDVVGGLIGPKGDQGPAGDISNLKSEYPINITTVGDETTVSAPEVITFKGGKIGESNATLDIDVERDVAVRFVTDNPSDNYKVIGGVKDATVPKGYLANIGSSSLTTLLSSKGDIKTNVDGVEGFAYTSQNPQPVTPPIVIDSSIEYASVEALIENPKKIVFDDNDDGITLTLDLDLSDLDSRPDYSVSFTVSNAVPSVGNCYVHHTQTDRTGVVGPSSTVTYFYSKDRRAFVGLQEQGGVAPYPTSLLDFTTDSWKIPDGNKTIVIPEGTIQNLASEVDGKQAAATVEIVCIEDRENPQFDRASHLVTFISDDVTVNGRQYIRTSLLKDNITSAPFKRIGEGSSGIDPAKGFTLDKGVDIKAILQDGSTVTDLIGMASNADNILIGSNTLDTVFEAKTGVFVDVNGDVKKVLLEGDTPSGNADVAGFGTVNEIPPRLHRFTTHEANIQATYQDDDFEVKFSNGEAGPVFEVKVTEDSKSVWELGFDYADKITEFNQVLGRVLIQYEPTKSTIPAKQFFDLVTLSCSKGQVKTFKKIHNNQDMVEFWVVANADNTDTRYLLSFDMQGQGDGTAEFLVKPPKFVDYVIPWDAHRLPPQILLHQEGMNNQGAMGLGSNIDSGSVRQGKVYVEDFTPASGGPSGLETVDEKKGFVIKWYEINDYANAGIFLYYNFAGDIYSKMNKSEGDKGSWKKLNNPSEPEPIVQPIIDKDNPLEVATDDGNIHDAIAINSNDDLVIGASSSTIKTLTLATSDTKIGVYRKEVDTGEDVVDRVVMGSELNQFEDLVPSTFNSLQELEDYFNLYPSKLKNDAPFLVSKSDSSFDGSSIENDVILLKWVGENNPSVYDPNLLVNASLTTGVSSLSLGDAHKFSSGGQNVLTINKVTGSSFVPPWSEIGDHSKEEGRYVKNRPTSREYGELLFIEPSGEVADSGEIDYVIEGVATTDSALYGLKFFAAENYQGALNYVIRSGTNDSIIFKQTFNTVVSNGGLIDIWFDFPVDSLVGDLGTVSIVKSDGSIFKVRPNKDGDEPYREIKTRLFNIKDLAYRSEVEEVNSENLNTYLNDNKKYLIFDKLYPAQCSGAIKSGNIVQMISSSTEENIPLIKEVSTNTMVSGVALLDGVDKGVVTVLGEGVCNKSIIPNVQTTVAGDIVYIDSAGTLSTESDGNTPIGYVMNSDEIFLNKDIYNSKFTIRDKPIYNTVDIVFWWSINSEPTSVDISNALNQPQTNTVISRNDGFQVNDLQARVMTAKRNSSEFKYAYFAWPKGFFTPEPTKIDTGWGEPSTWIESEVLVEDITYKVLTVEIQNNIREIIDYALVQEGLR